MKNIAHYKIVFDKKQKRFVAPLGDYVDDMNDAELHARDKSDEEILSEHDEDVVEFLEVWNVVCTMETE